MSEINRLSPNGDIEAGAARVTDAQGGGTSTVKHVFNRIASTSHLVRCAVLFAVAALLLVFAFCPLAKTVAVIDGEEYTVNLTGPDFIRIALSSVRYLGDEELEATSVYKELVKVGYTENQDLGSYSKREGASIVKCALFLELMSVNRDVRATVIIAAIAALVYIAFCILLFARSAFALAREVLALLAKKQISSKKGERGATVLLGYLLYMPLFRYILLEACAFGKSNRFAAFTEGGTGMAYGFVLSVIAALIGFAFLFTHKIVNLHLDGELKLARCKTELVSLAFAVVLLISFFLPAMSADIMLRYRGEIYDCSVKIGYFDIAEPTGNDVNYYTEFSSTSSIEEIKGELTDNAVYDGNSDTDKTLLHKVLIGCGRMDMTSLYVFVFIINALTLTLFAVISLRLVKRAVYSAPTGRMTLFKVLLLLSTLLQCALIFALSILANVAIGSQPDFAVNFSLAAGPILSLICAVGMLISTESKRKDEITVDSYYDNADVSYAPYVVGSDKR